MIVIKYKNQYEFSYMSEWESNFFSNYLWKRDSNLENIFNNLQKYNNHFKGSKIFINNDKSGLNHYIVISELFKNLDLELVENKKYDIDFLLLFRKRKLNILW